jgi:hypothetical protein
MIERVQDHQKSAISGYFRQRKLQFTNEKAQTQKEVMKLLENEGRELDLTMSILESQISKVRSLLNEVSWVETSVRPLRRPFPSPRPLWRYQLGSFLMMAEMCPGDGGRFCSLAVSST